MPLTLTEPLVTSIYSHAIKNINIDLESNKHYITISNLDAENKEVNRIILSLSIFDDFGNIIVPSAWPENNPTGQQMYELIEHFLFLGMQEQPGANGLGPGVIT